VFLDTVGTAVVLWLREMPTVLLWHIALPGHCRMIIGSCWSKCSDWCIAQSTQVSEITFDTCWHSVPHLPRAAASGLNAP